MSVTVDGIAWQQYHSEYLGPIYLKDKWWHEIFTFFRVCNMQGDFVIMTKKNQVPVLQLRRLLHGLKDLRPDICIRFRLIGKMWQVSFHRIISVAEKGVTLNNEKDNKLIFLPDLANVMQFEIDHTFQEYEPHFHYGINPELVY